MNKVNAKLYKQIMERMYPDPHKATEAIYDLYSHSLAEARREVVVQIKKNGFTRRRGESIRQVKLSQEEEIGYQMCQKDILDTLDLLTGDNPEEAL